MDSYLNNYRLQTNNIEPIYGGSLSPYIPVKSKINNKSSINEIFTNSNQTNYINTLPYNDYNIEPEVSVNMARAYASDAFVYPHMLSSTARDMQNKHIKGVPEEYGNFNNQWENLPNVSKYNLISSMQDIERTKEYNNAITRNIEEVRDGISKPINSYEPLDLKKLYTNGTSYENDVQPVIDNYITLKKAGLTMDKYYKTSNQWISPKPGDNTLSGVFSDHQGMTTEEIKKKFNGLQLSNNFQEKKNISSESFLGNLSTEQDYSVAGLEMINTQNRDRFGRYTNNFERSAKNINKKFPKSNSLNIYDDVVIYNPLNKKESLMNSNYRQQIEYVPVEKSGKSLIKNTDKNNLDQLIDCIAKIEGIDKGFIHNMNNLFCYDISKSKFSNELSFLHFISSFLSAVNSYQNKNTFPLSKILAKCVDNGVLPEDSIDSYVRYLKNIPALKEIDGINKISKLLISEYGDKILPQDEKIILEALKLDVFNSRIDNGMTIIEGLKDMYIEDYDKFFSDFLKARYDMNVEIPPKVMTTIANLPDSGRVLDMIVNNKIVDERIKNPDIKPKLIFIEPKDLTNLNLNSVYKNRNGIEKKNIGTFIDREYDKSYLSEDQNWMLQKKMFYNEKNLKPIDMLSISGNNNYIPSEDYNMVYKNSYN